MPGRGLIHLWWRSHACVLRSRAVCPRRDKRVETAHVNQEALGISCSLGAALCWATSVHLFQHGTRVVAPSVLNFFKIIVALVILAPLAALTPSHLTHADVGWLLLSGVCGITLADTLFFWALKQISASQIALVECLYSPAVVALAFLLLGERAAWLDLAGGGLVLAGVGLVLAPNKRAAMLEARTRRSQRLGVASAAAAVVLMALSVVMVKSIIEEQPVLTTTAIRLIGAGIGMTLLFQARAFRGQAYWSQLILLLKPQPVWRIVVPGAILGNCVALYLWLAGYKYIPAHTAAILNQTSTLFIVLIAVVVFREKLTRRAAVAVALGFGGCVIVLM